MRLLAVTVALVLVAVSAGPATAEKQCTPPREDGSHVCWDGFVGTEVRENTVLFGDAYFESYTDERDGGEDLDYVVTRDGVRSGVGSNGIDVQRVQYTGTSQDDDGETRTVRFDEVRVDAADRQGGVGLRRTSYSAGSSTIEVCDVYAFDESVEAPCSPVFP